MIEHHLDAEHSVLHVRPKASLEKSDFAQLAKTVDSYIEKTGHLAGLIIDAPAFPGWDSLGAMAAHFRFVRDHHKHIKKVALVTDSALGNVAEALASHFVSAEIRHFPAGQLDAAKKWIMTHD
jgi:SpoIIAA-like